MDIKDLLWTLQTRPDRYLADASLARIVPFLQGFAVAQKEHGIVDATELLVAFDTWVKEGYRLTTTCGAESIIRFNSSSENGALATFWHLMNEFLRQQRPMPKVGFGELMRELRIRLACYVAPRTIEGLLSFIRGFLFSQTKHGIVDGSDRFRAFEDFVMRRFAAPEGSDVESVIWFYSVEELAAIECFWQLWDEFNEEKGQHHC